MLSVANEMDFAVRRDAGTEHSRYSVRLPATKHGRERRSCSPKGILGLASNCHLCKEPQYYQHIKEHDPEFAATDHFKNMAWLRTETEDLYDPAYTDMLRVASGVEFARGKMSDLVSLLSGRDFVNRTFEETIVESSFKQLDAGVTRFMNENDFKFFTLILRSAGFVRRKLMRSQNAINFAYLLYLHLRRQGMYRGDKLQSLVRRWYVMSILTERATGSFESQFDYDIKRLNERDATDYLKEIETASLSDAFWTAALPTHLESPVVSSPFFGLFLAAQVNQKDHGLFSRHLTIHDMLLTRGDVHHIFPRSLLKKNGLGRSQYNRLSNLVYMDQPGNIKIGDKTPAVYFTAVAEKLEQGKGEIGGLRNMADLRKNMRENDPHRHLRLRREELPHVPGRAQAPDGGEDQGVL
jgi:hypothetical protein